MDYCNVYVNERSAAGQMDDMTASDEAVKALLDCLDVMTGCDAGLVTVKMYYSGMLYTSLLSTGLSIQNLHDKDLKRRFRLTLRGASCWDKAPLTDTKALYLHKSIVVTMSSMSESYEQSSSMLVNFAQSDIDEPVAVIEKRDVSTVEVGSYSDATSLLSFIIGKGWRRQQYDMSSSIPPHDEESILSDTSRFESTEFRYKGRIMYRRKGTDHLCYIDSKHFGKAAHIEEFNETTKKMVGTLRINEDKQHHPMTSNEKQRKLRLEK